jgi:hypothetical protein
MNDDIKAFNSYDDFMKVTREQPPYRGTTNVYPLGNRKYSYRHFRVQDNGELHLFYSNRENTDKWVMGLTEAEGKNRDYAARHLATVFPDNSIRIDNRTWMSDYVMFGAVTGFHAQNESRRGGLVIRQGRYVHPGFKGLRIMLNSCAPHPEMLYETHTLTLKRKESRAYMARYDDFLTTFPVMLNAMGKDAVREMVAEMRSLHRFDGPWVDQIMGMLEKKHYCDAAVALAVHKIHTVHWTYGNRDVSVLVKGITEHFRPFILSNIENKEEVFTITKHEAGKSFPTSTWPITVHHNNQPMFRL